MSNFVIQLLNIRIKPTSGLFDNYVSVSKACVIDIFLVSCLEWVVCRSWCDVL